MIEAPDHIPDLRRIKIMYSVILVMLGVILTRLWYLQILKGPELAGQAETQRTRLIRRVAARGAILDRKGEALATSRSRFVVSVLPDEIKRNPQVLPHLATILHTTVNDLNDQITEARRSMPFDPVPLAPVPPGDMTLPSQIEEQKLDLPGVLITKDPMRYYVDGRLFTHALGVTRPISQDKLEKMRSTGYHGGDYIGVEGLEKTYETDLRGKDGGQLIAVDARGRMQHSMDEIRPVPGHTLHLTLDRALQRVAYDALQEPLSHGQPGAVVALDPRDGAVLAFASVPSYDLNQYGTDYAKLLKDPRRPLINRVSGSHYPCGSTFKLITTAAGLETGAITPESTDYCSGSIQVGNRTFHCDKRSGHGYLGLANAIGVSCDVYFWHVAERTGQQALSDWAFHFGLGKKTGIDLPVDTAGIVPSPQWKRKHRLGPWWKGDLMSMAIGQGYVGVTPLQLADYTAAIANGGVLWRPQLVREIDDVSGPAPKVLHRLIPEKRGLLGLSENNRAAIVEGMTRVLGPSGTAAACAIPGLSVAGKTGTVEAFIKGKKANHSVFVCFAPVDHPTIAIAVLVEGGGFGAETAAPIARRMLGEFFGRHLDNIPIGGHHYGGD